MNLKRRAVAPDLDGLNLAYPLDRDSGAEAFVLGAEPRAIAAESAGEQAQVVWSREQPVALRLVSSFGNKSKVFHDVLSVRERTDERWPDQETAVDVYSEHYCMFVKGKPVGSLGVTRALSGPIFMDEYCPPPLLEQFGDSLVSAYRFRILREYRRTSSLTPGVNLSYYMVREAWRDQIAKGASIDLINIEKMLLPLYQRMGYIHCEGYDYIDPVLKTDSCLMFLPVDPSRDSIIRDLIKDTDNHVSASEVLSCLEKRQVYFNANA